MFQCGLTIKNFLFISLVNPYLHLNIETNILKYIVAVYDSGHQYVWHFKNVGKDEQEKTNVLELKTTAKTLLKIVWNSYDVVYMATKNVLYALWTEDEKGNPVNWQKMEHVRKL